MPTIGVLQEHLDNPEVNEIMVVEGGHLWLEDAHGLHAAGHLSPEQISQSIEHICRASGRRVDLLSPILDARLHDGSRACVVLPPISLGGSTINIRKFSKRILPLAAFGPAACTEQQLVRTSLRLRPDRLIVGEVRGAEAIDMLLALTTGHRGSWATVHATSARDTLSRLAAMITRDSPQWSHQQALELAVSAIDAIVYIERLPSGRRQIAEILHVTKDSTHLLYEVT